MVRSTLHGIFPHCPSQIIDLLRTIFIHVSMVLNSLMRSNRIRQSFFHRHSKMHHIWKNRRKIHIKGTTFVVLKCSHTLGRGRIQGVHLLIQCMWLLIFPIGQLQNLLAAKVIGHVQKLYWNSSVPPRGHPVFPFISYHGFLEIGECFAPHLLTVVRSDFSHSHER